MQRFFSTKSLVLGLLSVFSVLSHADIYKCLDENGKTRFSQAPCGQDAEKVELKSPSQGVNFAGEEKDWDSVKYANKEREINRELEKHKTMLTQLKQERAQKLARLYQQKQYVAKNIAGQRYERKLDKEIKRVNNEYKKKIEAETAAMEGLKRELEQNWK